MPKQEGKISGEELPLPGMPKSAEQDSMHGSNAPKVEIRHGHQQNGKEARDQGTQPRKIPRRKLYQDEIYGSKELTPIAVALIDTPEFQRLGHIYQLGMTHTIFRGANHRRLDHSVGTYFMSRTLMRRIVQNHARLHPFDPNAFAHPGRHLSPRIYLEAPGTAPEDQRRYSSMGRWRGLTEVVSAAALLHDLGHVAVGHTLEDEFSILDKHDELGGPRLFEFLYGPRNLKEEEDSDRQVDRFFEPIDKKKLPPPDPHDLRMSLPWVFENGIYDRFLPDERPTSEDPGPVKALSNSEIRDLLYLILSFKETINEDEYRDFDRELKEAQKSAEEKGDAEWQARLKFIGALYEGLSRPAELGENFERKPIFHPFMSDIVGNTICADLLDYLIRDGQRLRLDIRNNPRLQRYLVIRPESSFVKSRQNGSNMLAPPELRLTINAVYRKGLPRRDTVSDLLDLMRERYRFAEVVYYHPKKCAFSTMLAKALELAPYRPRDGAGTYPAPWADSPSLLIEGEPHIVHLGDESLLTYLDRSSSKEPDPRVKALVRRINYRDEYRLLFTLDYQAANEAGGSPRKIIRSLREEGDHDKGRKEWEQIFIQMLGQTALPLRQLIDDDLPPILIYCPNIRMQAKEVAARVELMPNRVIPLNQQHEDQTLRQEILVLNEKYQQLWRLYLFVHPRLAPIGGEQREGKVTFLNAVVDAFCEHYGVTPESRSRGGRFGYRPFRDRLGEYLQEDRGASLTKALINKQSEEIRKRIQEIARDLGLWSVALDRPRAPFPVSLQEYDKGFAQAVVVAAAENATNRQREEWPDSLQQFQAADWHREARTGRSNSERLRALEMMKNISRDLCQSKEGVSMRNPASSWEEITQQVSNAVKNTRSTD